MPVCRDSEKRATLWPGDLMNLRLQLRKRSLNAWLLDQRPCRMAAAPRGRPTSPMPSARLREWVGLPRRLPAHRQSMFRSLGALARAPIHPSFRGVRSIAAHRISCRIQSRPAAHHVRLRECCGAPRALARAPAVDVSVIGRAGARPDPSIIPRCPEHRRTPHLMPDPVATSCASRAVGRGAPYRLLSVCTASTSTPTCSGSMSGDMPWPRLKTWPSREPPLPSA